MKKAHWAHRSARKLTLTSPISRGYLIPVRASQFVVGVAGAERRTRGASDT